eukprot:3937131-Rhodomonas_salina.1
MNTGGEGGGGSQQQLAMGSMVMCALILPCAGPSGVHSVTTRAPVSTSMQGGGGTTTAFASAQPLTAQNIFPFMDLNQQPEAWSVGGERYPGQAQPTLRQTRWQHQMKMHFLGQRETIPIPPREEFV